MKDEILQTIQAEIDGLATDEDIAELDRAAASDPGVELLRREYHDMARAVAGMPAIEAPVGFTGRVMAALPEPRLRAAPSGVPFGRRIRDLVQLAVPRPRHRVAFAFALGVVFMLGINVILGDLSDPGADTVFGTMAGPGEISIPFVDDAGVLETAVIDGVRRVAVRPATPSPLRVTIAGSGDEAPDVALEVGVDRIRSVATDGSVVIETDRAAAIGFSVRGSSPVSVTVESAGRELLVWESTTGYR